jgi:hypothetical protein
VDIEPVKVTQGVFNTHKGRVEVMMSVAAKKDDKNVRKTHRAKIQPNAEQRYWHQPNAEQRYWHQPTPYANPQSCAHVPTNLPVEPGSILPHLMNIAHRFPPAPYSPCGRGFVWQHGLCHFWLTNCGHCFEIFNRDFSPWNRSNFQHHMQPSFPQNPMYYPVA